MTKTAQEVIRAWKNGYGLKRGNTETNGTSVFLFDKEIIRRDSGYVLIRTAGYPTRTTKDRLNKLDGVSVHTKNDVLFLNGKEWENHEEWTEII